MSEVIMGARPEDLTHVSNKKQSRPLSIISELDYDDLEVVNHSRHKQTGDSGTRDNASLSKETPESSKEHNDVLVHSKNTKSKRNHKGPKGQKKSSPKASSCSPKNQSSVKRQQISTPKSKSPLKNPTSTSHASDSQFEVSSQSNPANSSSGKDSKCQQTVTSAQPIDIKASLTGGKDNNCQRNNTSAQLTEIMVLPSDDKDNNCQQAVTSSLQSDIMVLSSGGKNNNCGVSLMQHSEITPLSNLTNSGTQLSRYQRCPSLKKTKNCSTIFNDDVLGNNLSSSRSSGNSQDRTIIGEDTDLLISSLSSTPSLQSLIAQSPTFGRRLLMQASRSLHEVNNPMTQSIPQITITPSEGTPRLAAQTPRSVFDMDDITKDNIKFPMNIISPMFTTDISNSKFSKDNSSKLTADINGSNSLSHPLTNRSYVHSKRSKSSALSKTKSAESIGSLHDGELNDEGSSILKDPENVTLAYLSDFWKLKETTEKLHLSTRRPSTMLWKQQYIEGQGFPAVRSNLNSEVTDESLTTDRKKRINDALGWLRNELQEMRSEDQHLARQLLTIRHEIHQLKLQRCTEEHQELIEDFQSELDDLQEFSDVLDFPQPVYGSNPLKHIGVTRLNISARRFSAC